MSNKHNNKKSGIQILDILGATSHQQQARNNRNANDNNNNITNCVEMPQHTEF